MVRDRQEKIIRDKISSLNGLPADYHPNLESKWRLLETSLPAKRRRTSLWYQVSAAAAILIASLVIWETYNNKEEARPAITETAHKPVIKEEAIGIPLVVSAEPELSANQAHVVERPSKPSLSMPQRPEPVVIPTKVPDTFNEVLILERPEKVLKEEMLAENKKKRRKRYVEIDLSPPRVEKESPLDDPQNTFVIKILPGQNAPAAGQDMSHTYLFRKTL